MYVIDLNFLNEEIQRLKPKKVILQLPLGLRGLAYDICKMLTEKGIEVIISSKPCWGACDIAISEARELSADAIVHIGHSKILNDIGVPVIYVKCTLDIKETLRDLVDRATSILTSYRRIGLGMNIQLLDFRDYIKDILEKKGFEVLYGCSKKLLPAQITGCDYSSMKNIESYIDSFFIVGSIFHGLGLCMLTEKDVVVADPETMIVKELSSMKRRLLAKRYASIHAFKMARRVGVLLCMKPGQRRDDVALKIVSLLKHSGKDACVIAVDEISEENLSGMPFDAYINTACPRISIDEQERFSKPILLPGEMMVALGYIRWEDLIASGEYLNPCIVLRMEV